MENANLLLLSNSKNAGSAYLEHARNPVREILGGAGKRIAFLPYAAVRFSFDKYESAVADAFPEHDIVSIHRADDARDVIVGADAIAVGGGNTFCLIHAMYENELFHIIRDRVESGVPYSGWSAGSNVACPTVRTTNDMPIIETPSFRALDLVPFQINPHYLDAHPDAISTAGDSYGFSKQCICAYVAQRAVPLVQKGIRMNALSPASTATPMLEDFEKNVGKETL